MPWLYGMWHGCLYRGMWIWNTNYSLLIKTINYPYNSLHYKFFLFSAVWFFEQQLFPCVWCDTYHYYHFLWEIDCNIVTLFQRRVAKIFVKFVVLPRAINATQCNCKLLSSGHTLQERFSQQTSNCSLHFSFLASDQIWQILKAT